MSENMAGKHARKNVGKNGRKKCRKKWPEKMAGKNVEKNAGKNCQKTGVTRHGQASAGPMQVGSGWILVWNG